jgi:hypothetical protein
MAQRIPKFYNDLLDVVYDQPFAPMGIFIGITQPTDYKSYQDWLTSRTGYWAWYAIPTTALTLQGSAATLQVYGGVSFVTTPLNLSGVSSAEQAQAGISNLSVTAPSAFIVNSVAGTLLGVGTSVLTTPVGLSGATAQAQLMAGTSAISILSGTVLNGTTASIQLYGGAPIITTPVSLSGATAQAQLTAGVSTVATPMSLSGVGVSEQLNTGTPGISYSNPSLNGVAAAMPITGTNNPVLVIATPASYDLTGFEASNMNGWAFYSDNNGGSGTNSTGALTTTLANSGSYSYRITQGYYDDGTSTGGTGGQLRKTYTLVPGTISFWARTADAAGAQASLWIDSIMKASVVLSPNTWAQVTYASSYTGSHLLEVDVSAGTSGSLNYIDDISVPH